MSANNNVAQSPDGVESKKMRVLSQFFAALRPITLGAEDDGLPPIQHRILYDESRGVYYLDSDQWRYEIAPSEADIIVEQFVLAVKQVEWESTLG